MMGPQSFFIFVLSRDAGLSSLNRENDRESEEERGDSEPCLWRIG